MRIFKNKIFLMLSLCAITIVALLSVGLVQRFIPNSNSATSLSVRTPSYDLTGDSVAVGNMVFGDFDKDRRTCTFYGIVNNLNDKNTEVSKLEIPQAVNYKLADDEMNTYTVTRIAFPGSIPSEGIKYGDQTYTGDKVTNMFVQSEKIKALIIPDTVEKIDMAALAGYCYLEYLKTPIVGEIIDSKSGIAGYDDTPFAAMFSYPTANNKSRTEAIPQFSDEFVNTISDVYYAKDSKQYNVNYFLPTGFDSSALIKIWYEINWYKDKAYSADSWKFYIPRSLQRVEVTKDTSLCTRAFNGCGPITELVLPEKMDLNKEYIFYGMNLRRIKQISGKEENEAGEKTGWIYCDISESNQASAKPEEGLTYIKLPKTCNALGIGCFGNNLFLKGSTDYLSDKQEENEKVEKLVEVKGELDLPNFILGISEGCFYNCPKIENIIMPESIQVIGDGAFSNCTNLKNLKIKDGTGTIAPNKGSGFNFPAGLQSIGVSAFANCKNITKVYISGNKENGLPIFKNMGASAFTGCSNITSVTIPFIGKELGNHILEENNKQDVYIGDGKYRNGLVEACFGYMFGGIGVTTWNNFNTSTETIVGTTNTIVKIGPNQGDLVSFWIPENLKEITITDETHICGGALQNLKTVTKMDLGTKSTYVCTGALAGCTALEYLRVGDSRTYYSYVGDWCDNHVTYHKYYTYINNIASMFGTDAVDGTYKVQYDNVNYYFPKNLTNIEISGSSNVYSGAFNNITSLQTCTIAFTGSRQQLGTNLFHNNPNLETLKLPFVGAYQNSHTYYHNYFHYWWWYTRVRQDNICWVFSDSPATNDYWYSRYWNSVYNEDATYQWSGYAKYIPVSLKNLIITNETYFSSYDMAGLRNLEHLTISSGDDDPVQYIANDTFAYLESLKSIELPFIGNSNRNNIVTNTNFTFWNLFSSNYTKKMQAVNGKYISKTLKEITINSESICVNYQAFKNMSMVDTINLNGEVTNFADQSFMNCTSLTHLNIKQDNNLVVNFGKYSFYGCKVINENNLFKIIDPENVENGEVIIGDYAFAYTNIISTIANPIDFTAFREIGDYAFSNCQQIEYVDIAYPSNVDNNPLGEGVFAGCTRLKSVSIGTYISKYLFKDCISLNSGYDKEKKTLSLINISEVDINYIPDGLFMGCKSLKFEDIKFKSEYTSIGKEAFRGCVSLGKFIFSESLETINENAFSDCLNLEPLTIPLKTTTIKPNAFNNNGSMDDFYFWVYMASVDWPSGWVENWNCDYLVYVKGDADPDIFIYDYDSTLKGYVITGLEEGNTLKGVVRFPEKKNGVIIRGIREDNALTPIQLISNQSITKVIIPSTYEVLSDNLFGKHTIEVYLEADEKLAKEYFGDSDASWVFMNNLMSGVVYTKDYWKYDGKDTQTSKTIPYLIIDKFKYEIDEETTKYLTFDGTAKTIALKSVTKVGHIYGSYDMSLPVELFKFKYSSNVLAGTAYALVTVDDNYLQTYYNKRNDISTSLADGTKLEKEYFTGEKTISFKISKKQITIFPNGKTIEKYYDNKFYIIDTFLTNEILGLAGTDFTLSGSLRCDRYNAGTYGKEAFYWQRLNIYKDGRNFTDNFEVKIGSIEYTIKPIEIFVKYGNAKWDTANNEYQANAKLSFAYIGSVIVPELQAYSVDEKERVRDADNYLRYDYLSYTPFFPTVNSDGTPIGTITPKMKIYLSSTSNYILRYYDGSHLTIDDGNNNQTEIGPDGKLIQSFEQEYNITKGKITIRYINHKFVIDPNADGFEFDKFTLRNYNPTSTEDCCVIKGFSDNATRIQAKLLNKSRTADMGRNKEGYIYKYDPLPQNTEFEWEKQTFGGIEYDYLILREEDGEEVLDNQYYDVIIEQFEVKINYNTFKLGYYINNERFDNLTETIIDEKFPTEYNSQKAIKIKLEADRAARTFTVNDTNYYPAAENLSNFSVKYLYGNGTETTSKPFVIQGIGTFYVGVQVTAKNFTMRYQSVVIEVVRADVGVSKFDKEYDALQVRAEDHITKKDVTQIISMEEYYKLDEDSNWVQCDPPYQVGRYKVKLKITYPPGTPDNERYFNDYDTSENGTEFEITKRKLYLNIGGEKPYDGYNVIWDFNQSSPLYSQVSEKLLNGDVFAAYLETTSADEGEYYYDYNSGSGDLSARKVVLSYWNVLNGNVNNTSNYDIIISGKYTINLLQMGVQITDSESLYDGTPHSIIVNVYIPNAGYTIYYSGESKPANSLINPQYIEPKSNPFANNDEAYEVNVRVTAPHYEPYEGTGYVTIKRNEVLLNVSNKSNAWTGKYQTAPIDLVLPGTSRVYYCCSTEDSTPAMPSSESSIGGSWSLAEPRMIDPGTYYIYALAYSDYYKAVIKKYTYTIGDYSQITDGIGTITNVDNAKYAGEWIDDEWVENQYSISFTHTLDENKTTVYYSLTGADGSWTEKNPSFSKVGTYTVYVKLVSYGYEPRIYEGTVNILKGDLPSPELEATDVTVKYDGKLHTIDVTYNEAVFKIPGTSIGYSIDENAYNDDLDYAFNPEEIYYSDTGKYVIYVAITNENYNIVKAYATLTIKKTTFGDIDNPTDPDDPDNPHLTPMYATVLLDDNIFEYSRSQIQDTDITVSIVDSKSNPILDAEGNRITNFHDGPVVIYYYNAIKEYDNTLKADLSERINNPSDVGYYYVEVIYFETKNCASMTAKGFIQITQRKLTLLYSSKVEYNGFEQMPIVKVDNLLAGDEMNIIITEVNDLTPLEIGKYHFIVETNMVKGERSNYYLDTDEFDYEITAIKITIGEIRVDELETDPKKKYSVGPDGIIHLTYNGQPIKIVTNDFFADPEYAELRDGNLITGNIMTLAGDRLELNFVTKISSVETYVIYIEKGKQEIRRNHFITAEYKVLRDEKDESGNITGTIDVTSNYEFEIGIEISKWYEPYFIPNIPDAVFEYDGTPHYPNIPNQDTQTPVYIPGNPTISIATTTVIDDNTVWSQLPIGQTEPGTYVYTIRASGNGREPSYKECKLIITEATINVTADDIDVVYDALEHNVVYNVTCLDESKLPTPIIKYYLKSEITREDLEAYYDNLTLTRVTTLNSVKEAGEYYAVVYYPRSTYYKSVYCISEINIARKSININITLDDLHFEKKYDGTPLVVNLGKTSDITSKEGELVPGHSFSAIFGDSLIINTISADVNVYSSEKGEFEFSYAINDENGKDVRSNYVPKFNKEIIGEILKADITADHFEVLDIEREYDGTPAIPTVNTDAGGKLRYIVYKTDSTYNTTFVPEDAVQYDDTDFVANASSISDAGYYVVVCLLYSSQNFNNLTQRKDFNVGRVHITPKTVEVIWENLTQEFKNIDLSPNAYIKDVNDTLVELDVIVGDFLTSSATSTKSGTKSVTAVFKKEYPKTLNYILANNQAIFEIVPIKIVFPLAVITDNPQWSTPVTLEMMRDVIKAKFRLKDANGNPLFDENGKALYDETGFNEFYNSLGVSAGSYITIYPNNGDHIAPGTYVISQMFNFNIQIYDAASREIITDGFDFAMSGYVTIEKQDLIYSWGNAIKVYDNNSLTIWDLIKISSPYSQKYREMIQISFMVLDAESNTWIEKDAKTTYFKDVGLYQLAFKIWLTVDERNFENLPSYDIGQKDLETEKYKLYPNLVDYHFIDLNITQAESYVAFVGSLDKEYDGIAVSKDNLKGSVSGGFNGSVDDLVFTFYEGNSTAGVPMDISPINVGSYTLLITSLADNVDQATAEKLNYTRLEQIISFSILPSTLNLDFKYDKEKLFNVEVTKEMVGNGSNINEIVKANAESTSKYIKGLVNGERFEFIIVGEYVRGHHIQRQFIEYDESTLEENTNYTLVTIKTEVNGIKYDYTLKYKIVKSDGNLSTSNYSMNLVMDLYLHLPFIDAAMTADPVAYDGKSHSGTLKELTPTSTTGTETVLEDIEVLYSTDKGLTYTENDYSETDPGRYLVYYKLVDNKGFHEDKIATFELIINKLQRGELSTEITDISKTYDGKPAGTLDNGTGYYLPKLKNGTFKYKFSLKQDANGSVIQDDYDASKIKIEYRNKSFSSKLEQAINAGEYTYTLIIPESKYYLETRITNDFTISQITIAIEGKYQATYNSTRITYNTFRPDASAITNINYNGLENVLIYGTVRTSAADVGVYSGADAHKLNWVITDNVGYYVYQNDIDIKDNISIDLSKFSIEIVPAQIEVLNNDVTVTYDGNEHGFMVTCSYPLTGYTLMYSPIDADINDEGAWKSAITGGINVGHYSCYVRIKAKNFETTKVQATLTILKETPYITIADLTREYKYEVLLPQEDSIKTNSTTSRENWTFTYAVLDTNDKFVTMKYGNNLADGTPITEERPINVGTYRITVYIPASPDGNYDAVEGYAIFKINPHEISMTWKQGESFTYTGNPQYPTAYITDEIFNKEYPNSDLDYTFEIRNMETNEIVEKPINARIPYSAKLVLANNNYTFKESENYYSYTILPASLEILSGDIKLIDNGANRTIGLIEGVYDATFSVVGLKEDANGNSHYLYGSPYFETYDRGTVKVGTYAYNSNLSNSAMINNFSLKTNNSANNDLVIYSTTHGDVTKNYIISINLKVTIDYSDLQVNIAHEEDSASKDWGIYTYNGKARSFLVSVKTANPSDKDYQIYYSLDNNNWHEYSYENRPSFTNVPTDSTGKAILKADGTSEPYHVLVKVNRPNYPETFTDVYIQINQANSNLKIDNIKTMGKVYDGTPTEEPVVTYLDKNKFNKSRISYQYFDTDTGNILTAVPSRAGNYQLKLTAINTNEFANYTEIDVQTINFTISKRPIAFNTNSVSPLLLAKKYDGTGLEIELNNNNFVYVNDKSKDSIVKSFDTAEGKLQTSGIDVGIYTGFGTVNSGLIQVGSMGGNGFIITGADGTDKSSCYDIDWTGLALEITKKTMEVRISNISIGYDGLPHVQTVESKHITLIDPETKYSYDKYNPYGYRIYYGLLNANLNTKDFLNEINAGNEDTIDCTNYGYYLDPYKVAQTDITEKAVNIMIIITCKNYEPYLSSTTKPVSIYIKAKSPNDNIDPDDPDIKDNLKDNPGGGYGEDDDGIGGGPGRDPSGGGDGTQKPGTDDEGETSIFKYLIYAGNVTYNGKQYNKDYVYNGKTYDKPVYAHPNYINDADYLAAQSVKYYYYGTNFSETDIASKTYYENYFEEDGKKYGPVNGTGEAPTDAGEYIFILTIDNYQNNVKQYFFQYFKIMEKEVEIIWGPTLTDMLDEYGQQILGDDGNPVQMVEFSYDGKAHIPTAKFVDVFDKEITLKVTSYSNAKALIQNANETNAGLYIARVLEGVANYTFKTNEIDWGINKKSIDDIVFADDLTVEYGKKIVLVDVNNYQYSIDEEGKITSIFDLNTQTEISFNSNDYPLTFKLETEIKPYLDSDNPQAGTNTYVNIVLDDKDNYQWKSKENVNKDNKLENNGTESDDLTIKYLVVPRNLENDEEWNYNIILQFGSAQPIYEYTGLEIRPYVRIELTHKQDSSIKYTMICGNELITDPKGIEYAEVLNGNILIYDFSLDYEDNIEPSDDPNKVVNPKLAKILIKTINTNFVFGYEDVMVDGVLETKAITVKKEFVIKNPYPSTIQLVSDSTMKFITTAYDQDTDSITIEGFDPANDGQNYDAEGNDTNIIDRDTLLETDSNLKDSIYLGRIYQQTYLSKYIEQIANDKKRIIVYDQDGNIVDRKYYDNSIFTNKDDCLNNCVDDFIFLGTSWKIELYDAEIVEADSTSDTGYKYLGTIDADNKVFTPADSEVTAIDSIEALIFGDGNGDGYINNNDSVLATEHSSASMRPTDIGIVYYALIVTYLTAEDGSTVILNNNCSVAITNCSGAESGSADDFNAAYILN